MLIDTRAPHNAGSARLGDLHRDARDSRSRRGQRSGVVQRASGSARAAASDGSADTRPAPPLLRQILHRQILHRDVATPEPVEHDLHLSLKAVELSAVMTKVVGDPGAAEEDEEVIEHPQDIGHDVHTRLPW